MRLVALSWLGSPCAVATRLSESTVSSLPRERRAPFGAAWGRGRSRAMQRERESTPRVNRLVSRV
eukprot:scaffold54748_cov63-Phaeocystis_antarctica.AAC.1